MISDNNNNSSSNDNSGSNNNIVLSCTAERDLVVCEPCTQFTVMASIKAPFYQDLHRAPLDLVTVIDRSGSMGGNKITLVKETLKFVVRQLKSMDRLSIITYDHMIETAFPLTSMDVTGKERATLVIDNIVSRGSTDLCGGLLAGIDVIKQRIEKSDVASVLLFTDGLANAGIQNIDSIITEMSKKAVSTDSDQVGSLPCTVHTFGFGSDHDVNMLKAISDKGNGVYFFIENKDSIADAFADCIGGLLSVVAQNISLALQGVNGAVITKVHTKFNYTVKNELYTTALGDIQSEEERDIVCSISLQGSAEIPHSEILTAKLGYFNVLSAKQEELNASCIIARRNDTGNVIANPLVDRQKNRIIAADAITMAKLQGDEGDYVKARQTIQTAIDTLKNSISANDPLVISLLADLANSLSGLQDRQSYKDYGVYAMSTYASSHYQQRATHTTTSYTTSAREYMKSKLDF